MQLMNKADIESPALMLEFKAGDEQAFDQVFHHFYPVLCIFAVRILPEQSAANDIAQEALIKAWQRKTDFQTLSKLKSFLFTCVRNACFDALEKRKVEQKYVSSFGVEELQDDQNVIKDMIHAEVVSRIFSQVDTLPEQCRRVIRMTFEEGKKPKEIAEELGISVSTVNSQKMRGLTLLREKLSDKDFLTALILLLPGIIH